MEKNSQQLVRRPLRNGIDEIEDNTEENESPKVDPESSTSDKTDDNNEDHKQEQNQPKLNEKINFNIWFILLPLLVAIAIFAYFKLASNSGVTEPLTANKVVEILKKKFSGQSKLSFKIIEKSIKKIINGTDQEPTQPSILLLTSSKGANETVNYFARELAHLISLPQTNYLTINGLYLKDINMDKTKKLIDNKIKHACEKQIPAVVLLQDLDMLSAFSANILFKYCDHENAPCKKAAFIMTISTGEVIPESADSKDFDRIADTHLRQSWHYMSNDLLSPLLSRITVSVVGILADKPFK